MILFSKGGIFMKNFYDYETDIGRLFIEADEECITKISFFEIKGDRCETFLIKNAHSQIMDYFQGRRKKFDFPLRLEGTDFQKSVWQELMKIPYGKTASYLDIAKAVGNPKACRAVGMANNKNNIAIVIPCHRVIGSGGKLVGYAGGLDVKQKLLDLEKDNL